MPETAVHAAVVVVPTYTAIFITCVLLIAVLLSAWALLRAGALTRRVAAIETERNERLDQIEDTLKSIRTEGQQTQKLLHVVIEGHIRRD